MRVKTGVVRHRNHKKAITLAKGYRMTRRRLIKKAAEAVLHAGEYAFAGRRQKKRDFRRLFIVRINAAARQNGLSYSLLMKNLRVKGVDLDRKILSKIAVEYPTVFEKIVSQVKK